MSNGKVKEAKEVLEAYSSLSSKGKIDLSDTNLVLCNELTKGEAERKPLSLKKIVSQAAHADPLRYTTILVHF